MRPRRASPPYDAHFDYLAWNRSYALVRHEPARLPDDRLNLLRWIFTNPDSAGCLVHWEAVAHALVLRQGGTGPPEAAGAGTATSG